MIQRVPCCLLVNFPCHMSLRFLLQWVSTIPTWRFSKMMLAGSGGVVDFPF